MALLRPLARLPLNTTVLEVPLPATCVLPSLPSHAGFHGQLGTGDHSSLKFPTSVSLGFKPCLVRLSYSASAAGASFLLSISSCPHALRARTSTHCTACFRKGATLATVKHKPPHQEMAPSIWIAPSSTHSQHATVPGSHLHSLATSPPPPAVKQATR